ncbi:hypothetical protein BDD12DRAFT_807466 [Trichophaea hybrida]|nr:hypothetical protein BDD12DRAFT_807466 [Trichophaea hybrida]
MPFDFLDCQTEVYSDHRLRRTDDGLTQNQEVSGAVFGNGSSSPRSSILFDWDKDFVRDLCISERFWFRGEGVTGKGRECIFFDIGLPFFGCKEEVLAVSAKVFVNFVKRAVGDVFESPRDAENYFMQGAIDCARGFDSSTRRLKKLRIDDNSVNFTE